MKKSGYSTTARIFIAALVVGLFHFVLSGGASVIDSVQIAIAGGFGALVFDIARTLFDNRHNTGMKASDR